MSNLHSKNIAALVLPYLALVSIHVLSGLQMEQPLIFADELGYLGNARHLSGTAPLPNMQGRQFYHFGYSLLLTPAFWLFADPVAVYKAVIVLNALLVSSLFLPLYFLLASLLEVPARTARWVAFACCLYPSLILYSSYAWSENAFIPFYALSAAMFGKLLASRSTRDALLFGLVAGFLYTIHPRALPVLAAVLVYLLVLALLRAFPRGKLVVSASALAAVFVVTRIVNQHLKANGWVGGGEVSATKLAGRLLPGTDYSNLMERALGQVLYLSLASHGLFLLGLVAMIGLIFRKPISRSLRRTLTDPKTGVAVFVLSTGFGVLLGSSALKLYSLHDVGGLRGADFIHGRYNEAFAVLAIAFALVELSRGELRNRQLVWRALVVTAAILALATVVMVEVEDALDRQVVDKPGAQPREEILPSEVDAIAVPAVYPLVELAGALDLYRIAGAVIASFLVITLLMRVSKRGGMALLMLLFLCFSYYNHRYYLLPRVERARSRLTFVANLQRLRPIAAISYDTAHRERGLFPAVQYLLPHTLFSRFDSRRDEQPQSEAVISDYRWSRADRLGARFVVASGRGSALWFLPGELQSRLPFASYEGVTLGVEPRLEFHETGFYRPERFGGERGRWTNGAATLTVALDPAVPPRLLRVEAMVPGRPGSRLQVLANGVELWHQTIPSDPWSKTFSLERVPLSDELLIELNSDTFSPAETLPRSTDRRRLGVVVRGIRLTARASIEDQHRTRNETE